MVMLFPHYYCYWGQRQLWPSSSWFAPLEHGGTLVVVRLRPWSTSGHVSICISRSRHNWIRAFFRIASPFTWKRHSLKSNPATMRTAIIIFVGNFYSTLRGRSPAARIALRLLTGKGSDGYCGSRVLQIVMLLCYDVHLSKWEIRVYSLGRAVDQLPA